MMINSSLIFHKFFKSPSPANFAEIMAMWPYLGDESKIIFFLEKSDRKDLCILTHLMNELCVLALENKNPYIRYLAAKEYIFNSIWSNHLDVQVRQIIQNDSHHLIKFLPLENKSSLLGPSKEDFLMLSEHQARLASVKSGEMEGEKFSDLIIHYCSHELLNQKISEKEIYEIVYTYLSSEKFVWRHTHYTNDGWSSYYQSKGLENLWNLAFIVPDVISFLLIRKLPSQDGHRLDIIPDEVLENLSEEKLAVLLYRSDVIQKKFRKKLFVKICEESNDIPEDLLFAVTSHNFDLNFSPALIPQDFNFKDEFSQILKLPKDRSLKILACVLKSKNCQPVITLASGDYLLHQHFEDDWWQGDFESKKEKISENIEKGLLDSGFVRDLRLYKLAKEIMPWNKEKPESVYWIDTNDLCFLLSHIKWGKTWETFKAFRDAWYEKYRWDESKDELLPEIDF